MIQFNDIYFLSSSWFSQNYWWILLIILILAMVSIYLVTKDKTSKQSEMSEETIEKVIDCFGGISNLVSAAKDGARLKFLVVEIEKCRLEDIKELGATGIFVSGKQVKFLFSFPADNLLERINSK